MSKISKSVMQEFRGRPTAYILQIGGLILIVLNLWLAYKLTPLAEGIHDNSLRLEVLASDIKEIKVALPSFVEEKEFESLENRLIRIEDKLDRHLE